jgi:hypothetical protein
VRCKGLKEYPVIYGQALLTMRYAYALFTMRHSILG